MSVLFELLAKFWPVLAAIGGLGASYLWGHKAATAKAAQQVEQAQQQAVQAQQVAASQIAVAQAQTNAVKDKSDVQETVNKLADGDAAKQLRDEWQRP